MAKKSRLDGRTLSIIGVALLAVITLTVVAFAFVRTPEPAAPTIDLAKAQAAQEKFKADQEAKAAAILAANAPLKVARPAARPLNVLFVGDSITVGRDASSEANSFRSIVVGGISESRETKSARLGDSGKTTAQVQPEAAALTDASDLVIVELGTNDLFKSTPEQFAVDYPALLDAVRRPSPDAPLICVGIWQSRPTAEPFDLTIESECTKRGGRFLSLKQFHMNSSYRSVPGAPHFAGGLTDGAHPNDDGHRLIATGILERINLS